MALLPQADRYLPYFLLYTSVSAFIHSIVCYLSPPSASLKAFSGPAAPPPHALLAHVYAVKNIYAALIRLYAAYHLENEQLYDLAAWTYAGVLILYVGEYGIWRTARMREMVFPFVNAGTGLLWMLMQRGQYSGS